MSRTAFTLAPHRIAFRRKLLRWYEKNKRDLPWRHSRDPYAIWIAETMLQQTQVQTVIPYYERFLAAFPTIAHLARAPQATVLRYWSGLGYYRRVHHLHKAARQIVHRHGGEFPRHPSELTALAGIGAYTAGAMLSIAFNQPYPAIDGNVRRVLARLWGLHEERRLRGMAAALVPRTRPGDFNQALMELGATICTAKNQRCPDCPVQSDCASARLPAMTVFTRQEKKRRSIDVVWPLAIVQSNGQILLGRRPSKGLLAGLWELPGGPLNGRDTITAVLARHLPDLGAPLECAKKLGVIRHAITYRRIRSPVYLFNTNINRTRHLAKRSWRWIEPSNLSAQPTSAMTVKAVRLFSANEKSSL